MSGKVTNQSSSTKSNFGRQGWSIIFMCMIGYFVGGGLNADGLNIYVGALTGVRGWESSEMLVFSTYGGWFGILLTFFFGHVIAKKVSNTRWVMAGSMIVSGIAMYFYGHSTTFWIYALSVATVASFNAGYSLVAPNVIQANWFPRKKGLALGWSTMGFPLCTMIWPFVTSKLLSSFGVENMFTILSVFVCGIGIIMIFWCKPTPEEVGCAPDNDPLSADELRANQVATANYQSPWTLKALVREKNTWFIGVGLGLIWMVTVAIISQLVPRLVQVGYDSASAVNMLCVVGFFGIFGSYLWGYIDQKVGTKKASLVYCVWYVVALILIIWMPNNIVVWISVGMVGISVGGICNLIPSMIGTVYGRKDFSAANRLISAVTKGICATAYIYLAQTLKIDGTFTPSYIGLIIICVIAAGLISQIKILEHN